MHGNLYLASSIVTLVVRSFHYFCREVADPTVSFFQFLFPWLIIVRIFVRLVESVYHIFCSGLDRRPTRISYWIRHLFPYLSDHCRNFY